VYLSEITHESEWVNWEARESIAQGKGVIYVHSGETPPSKLPAFINEFGLKIIPWKHKELSEAIETAAKKRS